MSDRGSYSALSLHNHSPPFHALPALGPSWHPTRYLCAGRTQVSGCFVKHVWPILSSAWSHLIPLTKARALGTLWRLAHLGFGRPCHRALCSSVVSSAAFPQQPGVSRVSCPGVRLPYGGTGWGQAHPLLGPEHVRRWTGGSSLSVRLPAADSSAHLPRLVSAHSQNPCCF